jgi:hypothetical protein
MPIPDAQAGLPDVQIDPMDKLAKNIIDIANLAISGQITLTEWEERIKKEIG